MSNKVRYAFGFWKSKKWFWHPSQVMHPGVDPDFDFMFGGREQLDLSFREEPYQAQNVLEHPENPVRSGIASEKEGVSSPAQGKAPVEREFEVTTTFVVTKKVRVHAANNAKAAAEAQKKVNKERRKIQPFKKFKLGKFIGKAATKLIERRLR